MADKKISALDPAAALDGTELIPAVQAGGNVQTTTQDIADLGGGAVDSVNGQTGTVVLDADDIDDTSTTNKFVSATDVTNLGNLSGTNTGDQTGGTPALTLSTANSAGSSPNFLRRDDTILAFDATSPSTQAYGDSAVVGVATVAARRDHKHAMPATTKDTTANSGVLKGNGTTVSGGAILGDLGTTGADFSMNSHKLTSVTDPTSAQDAATKAYVDAVAQGLSVKGSVLLATAAALPTNTYLSNVITITATGTLTVDGTVTALNDRILVKDESSGLKNGIYTVTTAGALGVAAVLTRSADMDASAEFPGGFVFVESGTVNTAAGFVCTNSSPPTVGTTAITFTQFSGAGEITAGNGLGKSGNTLSIDTSITVDKTTAQALTNKDVTSGTNTFPTFNQNTSGTAANLSGTPTVPNGTAATTQSQADNSTKLATTAYVDTGLGGKQGLDSDLTTIAGLTATTDNFMQSKSSAWASRTPTQVTADLIGFVGDSGSGGTKGLVPAPSTGDATKYLKGDGTWATVSGGGGSGDVVGPSSATDNAVARFDSTTGKLIQNSAVTIADTSGNMAGVGTVNTFTLPSSDFVGRTDSQTLTNKTLTSPVLNTPTVGTSILPTSDDGAPLGSTSKQFSDLFLASGGVINFNNGDVTLTHASDALTLAGGSLGIGATPDSVLTAAGQTTIVAPISGSTGHFIGVDAAPLRITFDTHSGAAGNVASGTAFMGRKSRGTAGTPTATQANDTIISINGRGYGASQFAAASTGLMSIKANENFTNSANGTYISFDTTPDGSVTAAEVARFTATGLNVPIVNGGSTSSTDLTLNANTVAFAQANTGRIKIKERIVFTGFTALNTAGATNLMYWQDTIDATGSSAASIAMAFNQNTIQYDTSQGVSQAPTFAHQGVVQAVGGSIADSSAGFWAGYSAYMQHQVAHSSGAGTTANMVGFIGQGKLSRASGTGTHTITNYTMFNAFESVFLTSTVNTGYTVTTARAFHAQAPSVSGGTITNNVLVDIARPTSATTNIGLRNAGATVFTPLVKTITAVSDSISVASTHGATVIRINNTSGSSKTLTSTPTITDGVDGQIILLYNTSANIVSFQDQGSLAGSNLRMVSTGVSLDTRDSCMLMYSSDIGDWIQITPAANVT